MKVLIVVFAVVFFNGLSARSIKEKSDESCKLNEIN